MKKFIAGSAIALGALAATMAVQGQELYYGEDIPVGKEQEYAYVSAKKKGWLNEE